MVIGLRFFHTLGIVGLFQDCEQGEGRILGPGEDLLVLLLNVACLCLLQEGEQLAALSSLFRQRPALAFITPVQFLKGFIVPVLAQGWSPTA